MIVSRVIRHSIAPLDATLQNEIPGLFEFCSPLYLIPTVESASKTCLIGHKYVLRRVLVVGPMIIKTCSEGMVFQDKWSLMAVVSPDNFYCTSELGHILIFLFYYSTFSFNVFSRHCFILHISCKQPAAKWDI